MKVRNLLLGSAAAMLAGGANTAQAADTAGLAVVTMATAAAYVELCNSTRGVLLRGWCITPSGEVVVRVRLPYGMEIEGDGGRPLWGNNPFDTETDEVTTTFGTWGGFQVSTRTFAIRATRATDHGTLTINIPVTAADTGAFITLGDTWRWDNTGMTITGNFGNFKPSIRIGNPGTLGWNDPRIGGATQPTDIYGPWPDLGLDLKIAMDNVDIGAGFNIGQRTDNLFGPVWSFLTMGGYLEAGFAAGPADLDFRFDWDRGDAWGDLVAGVDAVVYMFGLRGDVAVDIGDRVALTSSVRYGRNFGGYTSYRYNSQYLGNYWAFVAGLDIDIMDGLVWELDATFATGPRDWDATLILEGKLVWKPASASPLTITAGIIHERQLFSATAPGNPFCDALDGPCVATRANVTVGAAF